MKADVHPESCEKWFLKDGLPPEADDKLESVNKTASDPKRTQKLRTFEQSGSRCYFENIALYSKVLNEELL